MMEIDVQLERGEFRLDASARLETRFHGLFGPSGSGKTTLFHLIAGLLRPTRGRIVLDGDVLVDTARGISLPPHRRRVGVVFQDARLFPHLTVRRNLLYGEKRRSRGRAVSFDEVVDLLELGPLLTRSPRRLSGGEAQRVAIGRALLSAPRLLLLDEPLSALDQKLKRQILPFLRRVRDHLEIPVIYITHEIGEVLELTHRLLILDRGVVAAAGDYHDISQDHRALELLLAQGLLNVHAMVIAGRETEAGLSRLEFPDGSGAGPRLAGPWSPLPAGTAVTVFTRPEDFALSAGPLPGISIQNQFPARIVRHATHAGRTIVEVDAGVPFLVEVSHASWRALEFEPGDPVHCLLKSNAIRLESA